jgi:uncharacterized membrane-anchored protein YhcB (DUF1043 family)
MSKLVWFLVGIVVGVLAVMFGKKAVVKAASQYEEGKALAKELAELKKAKKEETK